MSWIKEKEIDEADIKLSKIYDEIIRKRGKLSNIMKVQSLNPDAMKKHMDLYLSIMFGRSKLSREEREIIAVAVSKVNGCKYCINHHSEALNHYWKDKNRIKKFLEDFNSIDLDDKKKSMINYIVKLTNSPDKVSKKDIKLLRDQGFLDKDILDINLICSYFNFVNRIALGLGVKYSDEEIKGYKN